MKLLLALLVSLSVVVLASEAPQLLSYSSSGTKALAEWKTCKIISKAISTSCALVADKEVGNCYIRAATLCTRINNLDDACGEYIYFCQNELGPTWAQLLCLIPGSFCIARDYINAHEHL